MKKILLGMLLAAAGCASPDPAKPETPASEKPAETVTVTISATKDGPKADVKPEGAVEATVEQKVEVVGEKPAEAKKPEAPKVVEAKKPEAPKPAEAKKPEAPKEQKIMDIRPDAAAKTGATSVEWENKNDAALKATVNDAKIAELLKGGDAAAAKLLAEVKPNFQTDPLQACLIAGVSQSVMRKENAPYRTLWTKALLAAAAQAKEPDVVEFHFDQLRWCGTADQAAAILKIADGQKNEEVKKFARMVARELGK